MSLTKALSARRRTAAVLIIAMVVLLVLTLLGGEFVRTMVIAHRRSAQNQRELQCLWLAESGVTRGLAQLESDADYDGESWLAAVEEAPADDPVGRTGRVTIAVETIDGRRQLKVEAIYPDHPTDRVSVERVHSLPSAEEESP